MECSFIYLFSFAIIPSRITAADFFTLNLLIYISATLMTISIYISEKFLLRIEHCRALREAGLKNFT